MPFSKNDPNIQPHRRVTIAATFAAISAEFSDLSPAETMMLTAAAKLLARSMHCANLSRAEKASAEARSILRELRARRLPAAAPGAALKADALEAYAATVRERERISGLPAGNAGASS